MAISGAVVVISLAAAAAFRSVQNDIATPVDLRPLDYVTSASCQGCHPAHHKTWHQTFHRTMTQEATDKTVLGDFNDQRLVYEGVTSSFRRSGDGYSIETLGVNGEMGTFPVVRTVGSRRVQQYLTKQGDRYFRLPLAWNVEEKKWLHLNGGFLHPDGSDFNSHTALWDANCVFCHNTKPNPAMDMRDGSFSTRVAELGIACEACHGPGSEHVKRNSNPLRRYLLHYSDQHDPTIIDPKDLPKERQVQICGHCHGQRIPSPRERIKQFVTEGDPYTAGDDLHEYVEPMSIRSQLGRVDLSLRFWRDGTPRLTAYEYQGLLMSVDYQKGNLTCISCHTMHGGDPRGMITSEMRGPKACQQCHAKIVANAPAHTKHAAGSSGSDCYSCHMPKITYGLLAVHPTHRIQRTDPARAWRYDMPEACTLCHVDKTAVWAAKSQAAQYGSPVPADLPVSADFQVAENVRALLAGDVVQRSVAVMAFSAEGSYTKDPVARLWAVPFLLLTLEDSYPAVRFFAWRSLRALLERAARTSPALAASVATLPQFDHMADREARAEVIAKWNGWWLKTDRRAIRHPGSSVPLTPELLLDREVVRRLQAKQQNNIIAIGE